MGEEIYYRGGKGNEIRLDPASLNMDELPLLLGMAGWTVMFNYPEVEHGEIEVCLLERNASFDISSAEIAISLNMIDPETGDMLPGYSISDESGYLEISYKGIADIRFAEFVKALHKLSS